MKNNASDTAPNAGAHMTFAFRDDNNFDVMGKSAQAAGEITIE